MKNPIRETDAGTFTYSGARGRVNYLSEAEAGQAFKDDLRSYANWAYANLGPSTPEFGAETRTAIIDTAGDALYEAGFRDFEPTLREVVRTLA